MNYKNILSFSILASAIIISGVVASSALAQINPFDIQFPIEELGNCTSMENCKIYCDKSQNSDACFAYAEKNNLMPKEEIEMAKKFKDVGMIGPGGCKGQTECDKYCDNSNNIEECMAFAIENGMMDTKKQEESKKILAAIKRGVKMPACNGQKECDAYCSSSEHMEECMNFSIEAGIMDPQKLEESKKVLAAIKRGVKMPACNGQKECDAYCSSSEHMEECMIFTLEAGLMPDEDKEGASKMLTALKKGVNPPACRGEKECDIYCSQEEHVDECVNFAEAAGFMTKEEAEMTRKTRGRGPGGCTNPEECDVFCSNPDNQEICFEFGKENGMISEKDLGRMDDGRQRMKESLAQAPAEIINCLSSSLGIATLEKLKAGTGMLTPKTGEAMDKCFRQFAPQGMMPDRQGEPGMIGGEMPADLKDCIRDQIGEDGLNKIQIGQMNDPALMEKASPCFEKFGQQDQQGQPEQMGIFNKVKDFGNNVIDRFKPDEKGGQDQQGQPGQMGMPDFENMPAELKSCLELTLGADIIVKFKNQEVRNEDMELLMEKAKPCFEKFAPSMEGSQMEFPQKIQTETRMMEEERTQMQMKIESMPSQGTITSQEMIMSQEMIDCLRAEVGEELANKIKSGAFELTAETGEKAKKCFEKFDIRVDTPQMDIRQQDNQIAPTQQIDMMKNEVMEKEMYEKKMMEGTQTEMMKNEVMEREIIMEKKEMNMEGVYKAQDGGVNFNTAEEKEMYERKMTEGMQDGTMPYQYSPTETQQFDPNAQPMDMIQDGTMPPLYPNSTDMQQFDPSIEPQIAPPAPSSFLERLMGNVLGILSR
ncbi:hypothetical protein KJ671_01945 [Patescibacteria group bacterium]|nr:hypothetical protein [Patescibacteria group bacterium]